MRDRPLGRRAFLAAIAMVAGQELRAHAAAPVVAEDWRGAPIGSRGVPPGWQRYETPGGHPAYDFAIVEDAGRRALRMRSADDHSTIAKSVEVSLEVTPVLAWQWRMIQQPAGADLRKRETSDAAGHLFAVWPRFPAFLRSRLIGYIWDPVLPVGTVLSSQKTGTVTYIVARSGAGQQGQWVDEQRDVARDHAMLFGESAATLPILALSIDTNDTRATAETLFGRIEFRPRS
ncbi:MAG TPA: DUF3047 domain-containing protein [Methylomirabilota bacterium]|nr:DUF3047 domain-containing protein [Methylomirabilota bacterium]